MARCLQNKSSFDVADDESLSFAGFVCIQDQKLNCPPNSHQIHKQDTDFEFSHARQESTTTDPSKFSPADLLISNGKLLPQAFLYQSKQQLKMNQPHRRSSSPPTFTHSKRSGDKTGARAVSYKQEQEQSSQLKKEDTASRPGFAWKLLKSFASPCRECKAIKPGVKTQTIPRESLKLY